MQIQLKNISKSFGGNTVIHPLSLTIESGSFTTLLGPSGCGKTTLLRMIAGLESPDDGDILFDGHCVFSRQNGVNLPPERRKLGFVFQDFALWPHMTVYENVAFGLRARKDTAGLDARVHKALSAVQLDGYAQRYPHQLSGGQQQRVAFARAIVVESDCVLFDEPLSALDALLREEMRTELTGLVKSLGLTAVFVTHDQIEAMSMSDRIVIMHDGVIEQIGTPEEIYARPATPFAARFVGKSNWMDENTMFRPEDIVLDAKAPNSIRMTVQSVQFLGSSYELRLDGGGHTWFYTSATRAKTGDVLPVYIDREKLRTFAPAPVAQPSV